MYTVLIREQIGQVLSRSQYIGPTQNSLTFFWAFVSQNCVACDNVCDWNLRPNNTNPFSGNVVKLQGYLLYCHINNFTYRAWWAQMASPSRPTP